MIQLTCSRIPVDGVKITKLFDVHYPLQFLEEFYVRAQNSMRMHNDVIDQIRAIASISNWFV